jgi:hypothetical protein
MSILLLAVYRGVKRDGRAHVAYQLPCSHIPPYIDGRASISFVHRNPFQKLTALDAERISFPDAVQQLADKTKRYEAGSRR